MLSDRLLHVTITFEIASFPLLIIYNFETPPYDDSAFFFVFEALDTFLAPPYDDSAFT
jgi:hypothetical protein